MNVPYPPFSNSSSRPMPAFQRAEETFANTLEQAKNVVSTRLAACSMLSFNEKMLVQSICEAILAADVARLQKAISDLSKYDDQRDQIVAIVANELRCPGVAVAPLQSARWRFSDREAAHWVAVFSIHLLNARRIFAIATDDRFGAHVFARDEITGGTEEVQEDARILLRQIGRLVASELTSGPPPFSSGSGQP